MAKRQFFPMEDLRELMDTEFVNKRKIHCIKHILAMTGVGLREAKDFFEQEWLPFVNGDRKPPETISELIEDTPDFQALKRQVEKLTDEVNQMKSQNVKSMASGLFN